MVVAKYFADAKTESFFGKATNKGIEIPNELQLVNSVCTNTESCQTISLEEQMK